MSIRTARLALTPLGPETLLALLEGVSQFEARAGVRAAAGLRDFFVSGEVSPAWVEGLRAAKAANPWVHGFAVVEPQSATAVGTAGFKGPPDEAGVVEIAYAIVPACERRGYATEAAQALVQFAFADARVHLVRAHTLPTPNGSTRVLDKCGFERVGELVDPEDGLVWRWDRRRVGTP